MGEQKVSLLQENEEMQKFVKSLLDDMQALEYMLENNWFETGITRIGAEQEMCLVNSNNFRPATNAMEALEAMKKHKWVETELAKFNLETNLEPATLKGSCFSDLEKESNAKLSIIKEHLEKLNTKLVLTGILPTLTKSHLSIENLTPMPRYYALIDALKSHLDKEAFFQIYLEGIDELRIKHDSPLIEACNTSFQVHLQIEPHKFAKMYNIAQALAGPVMAIAANSPIVFGKRLWHESRIAMFQQGLDTRSSKNHLRERSPRVHFGKAWMKNNILDIYREDIARYRVLLAADVKEDSLDLIAKKQTPKLRSLQVHNSTVYRWNRPVYGVSDNGSPHLRIENRVLPSGPTVVDEVANAVFWIGAMIGLEDEIDDIRNHMSFADVSDNFLKAAKFGIDSNFNWFNEEKYSTKELINKLLVFAKKGLEKHKIDKGDIEKYLGIIKARAENHTNGARWQLRAYTKLKEKMSKDEALAILTQNIIENQEKGIPVHEWKLPSVNNIDNYKPGSLSVDQFMETDVFTVRPEDIVELTARLMDWRDIRYIPVENKDGQLIGLITSKLLLRHYNKPTEGDKDVATVGDVMEKHPLTIGPKETIKKAMYIMRENNIGCLPVIDTDNELLGIITEMDFLRITGRLLDEL